MKVLAIETSCDDTSVAIVSRNGDQIVCDDMVSFHQISLHENYGGVVPELASREHLLQIIPVLQELCLRVFGTRNLLTLRSSVDSVAVTHTPGLPGSLVIGRTAACTLAAFFDKPCVYINHLHGHIFSWILERSIELLESPTLVLSVSGGHSDISLLYTNVDIDRIGYIDSMDNADKSDIAVGSYILKKLASTRDDAIGEVFDKISRMLGGPYPGGQWISEQATLSPLIKNSRTYPFPYPSFKKTLLKNTFDFSFSGMKAKAFHFIALYKDSLGLAQDQVLPANIVSTLAYEFQETAADILVGRITELLDYCPFLKTVALVGGVSANVRIREKIEQALSKRDQGISFYTPTQFSYCTDNAAMIGAVAILNELE